MRTFTRNRVIQKQPLDVFCKKGVLKNFAEFTGIHLSFLFNKVAGLGAFL